MMKDDNVIMPENMEPNSQPVVTIQRSLLLENPMWQPLRSKEHSSAYLVSACLKDKIVLDPMMQVMVPTGFSLDMSGTGMSALIMPISHKSHQQKLTLGYGATLVDLGESVEKDELFILMKNPWQGKKTIMPGEPIAQLIFARLPRVDIELCITDLLNLGGY